jgi:transposase
MRPCGSAAVLEDRRRRAIDLLSEGKTPSQVAEIVGVVRQTVQRWKAMVREGGKRALKAKPQHVPKCRLSGEQQQELGKIIAAGASASGYSTDLWTTARIAEVIWQQFKIRYNHDHVGRLLHRLGYSCQKPSRKAREQDEQAAQAWRRREWPRIKKGR